MDTFTNIAITQSGMLTKILTPVLDQNKRPAGYMCEHTHGSRSFVAVADTNYCDRSNLNCAEDEDIQTFGRQDQDWRRKSAQNEMLEKYLNQMRPKHARERNDKHHGRKQIRR